MATEEESESRLTLYILIAIVAAVILAVAAPSFAMSFRVGGEVFLRLLKMMVVPLVMASVMSGIIGLGDVRRLGRPGGAAVLYYVSTTALAVLVGLVVVNIIRPGIGTVDQATLDAIRAEGGATVAGQQSASIGMILENLLLMLFTDNLISSAAETNLLPLIAFSIIFAGMLTTMGERVRAITQMIVQVNDALLSFIMLLMKLGPLGIFCLVTARFGKAQAEGQLMGVLSQTGWYFLTVILGLAFHALITLPLILWFFTRRNPYRFMYQMSQALLTAFSTASSSATLPVTMECAIERAASPSSPRSSSCPWGPPSTWTAPLSTRRPPPSSSPRRSGWTLAWRPRPPSLSRRPSRLSVPPGSPRRGS